MAQDECPVCRCLRVLDEFRGNPDNPDLRRIFSQEVVAYQDKLVPKIDLTALKTSGCVAHARWNWYAFTDFVEQFNSAETKELLFGTASMSH
jgi:hypothetical protein